MSGIDIGQAIGIIGGSPILKNVLGHTVDGLKIPRHLDVGSVPGMSSIMSGVLSGGIGSLLQSPLGAALAPLTSALTSGQASVTSALGEAGAPLNAALQNLSTSATNLSGLADNIVGFSSNPGLPSQLDAIGHMNLAQSLGSALPASMSLATVLAPTSSAGLLSAALAGVQPIIAQASAGTMSVADAVTATAAIQSGLDAITTSSAGAIASLHAMAPSLAAGQGAVALLLSGSPEMTAAMQAAIRPDMLAAVQAVLAAHAQAIGVSAGSQNIVSDALASIATAQAEALASAPTP